MSSLAADYDAINLGQGFPDFQMDEALTSLVSSAMNKGMNQYTHMNGYPQLRERISEKLERSYQYKADHNTAITITPGGTYAIYTALTTIINPGDEVIIFEPAYDSYIPNIEINGGVVVPVELKYPRYRIDWEEVRKKLSSKTKAIIINTPHNPTGSVFTEEDIAQLRSVTEGTGIFIISDEVYEHIIFDGKKHFSMLNYPDLMQRSFVCFSFGKVYHCTGWKLGYCVAEPANMKEFRKVHQFNAFTCNTPMQVAISNYIQNMEAYNGLGAILQNKRDFLLQAMNNTGFRALPSHGSYFQLYSYKGLSEESENDFAIRLVKEAGVATIPVSAFYKNPTDNKVLRFCFAKKESTLEQAAKKLQKLFGS